ncbi:MAG: hypothetical protein J6U54_15400 [Clostridiales bacterium]|nr:hypothetical protein [Clostridiales bacterium]
MTRKEKDLQLEKAYEEVEQIRTKFNELGNSLFRLKDELQELASKVYITSGELLSIKEKIWRAKDM